MSVIAKMTIRAVTAFGTGQLVELGCVCDNDLMAAHATSEEDKLFTQYSPWGEMKLCQPAGSALGQPGDEFGPGAAFYVMVLSEDEHPAKEGDEDRFEAVQFPGSYASCPAILDNIVDYGDHQARRLEFRNGGANTDHRGVDRLNWKMSVDNPAVFAQMKPKARYWIALYPAPRFSRDTAIAAAHGHLTA